MICERVIQDAENQAFSIINLYDRLTFRFEEGNHPTKEKPLALPITVFLSFRTTGQYEAEHIIRIVAFGPARQERLIGHVEVPFTKGTNGGNVTAKFAIALHAEGHYYFDCFMEKRFLTRIPLQVTFASESTNSGEDEGLPLVMRE